MEESATFEMAASLPRFVSLRDCDARLRETQRGAKQEEDMQRAWVSDERIRVWTEGAGGGFQEDSQGAAERASGSSVLNAAMILSSVSLTSSLLCDSRRRMSARSKRSKEI